MSGGKVDDNKVIFIVRDGDVCLWIEPDEAIYMEVDSKYRAPVELTSRMAKQLAAALLEMASRLDD